MEKEDKKNWFYFVVTLVKQLRVAFTSSIKFDSGLLLPEQKTYQQKSYFLQLGFIRLELFTNKF